VSPARRDESGIPHARQVVTAPPGSARTEENWSGANEAKSDKLRHKSLHRRARAEGIELRHSAHGYALIDPSRRPVEDRHDLTLDEVEALLDRA